MRIWPIAMVQIVSYELAQKTISQLVDAHLQNRVVNAIHKRSRFAATSQYDSAV